MDGRKHGWMAVFDCILLLQFCEYLNAVLVKVYIKYV